MTSWSSWCHQTCDLCGPVTYQRQTALWCKILEGPLSVGQTISSHFISHLHTNIVFQSRSLSKNEERRTKTIFHAQLPSSATVDERHFTVYSLWTLSLLEPWTEEITQDVRADLLMLLHVSVLISIHISVQISVQISIRTGRDHRLEGLPAATAEICRVASTLLTGRLLTGTTGSKLWRHYVATGCRS